MENEPENAYDPDKLTDPEYEEIFGEPRLRRKKKTESEKKRDKIKSLFGDLTDKEREQLINNFKGDED